MRSARDCAFDFRRNRTSSRHEQGRQRRIDPIADQPMDAGRVVSFPQWIGRQGHVGGPTRNCARWKDNRVTDGLVPAAASINIGASIGTLTSA